MAKLASLSQLRASASSQTMGCAPSTQLASHNVRPSLRPKPSQSRPSRLVLTAKASSQPEQSRSTTQGGAGALGTRRGALLAASALLAPLLPSGRPAHSDELPVGERSALATKIRDLLVELEEIEPEEISALKLELEKEEEEVRAQDPLLLEALAATEAVALVGAVAGGVVAQQRGAALQERERALQETAEKLRKVNQEIEIERRKLAAAQRGQAGEAAPETDPVQAVLRSGRRCLDEERTGEARRHFEEGLRLGQQEASTWALRKAHRGLAAVERAEGNLDGALEAMKRCLAACKTDAERCNTYGYLADLMFDMDRVDEAGEYYDLYLATVHAE